MTSPDGNLSSDTAEARDEMPPLIWVRYESGRVRVRYGRVITFLITIVCAEFVGGAITRHFAEVPIDTTFMLATMCVVAAYLVVVIELQRRRLQYGSWKLHLSLRTLLLLTALAAAFFAVVSRATRENQRLMAVNVELQKQLEAVLQGGTVAIGMPGGARITCQATRASFSDDDLAKVIALASEGGTRPCELSMLFLSGTSVTNAGVRQLAACDKLVLIDLPPLNLDTAALDALVKCRRLEFIIIDERRLTREQGSRLREALPKVRLNGRTWAERDAVK